MNTRFGRHVMQDLADLSGQEVSGLRISRLASRYEAAIAERKTRERANTNEFRLNIPHVAQVQKKIAEQLEEDAARINGKLPIASVFDALQIVKARKDVERDAGLRALRGHLESMWKRSRTATITASSYLKLHEHYARTFPRSAAKDVIVEIGQRGYTTLPRADLHHIASEIQNQEDYDRAMVKYGLSGPQPHQVKARKYILALLNDEEVDLPFEEDWDEPREEPWEAREEERERHRRRRERPKEKAAQYLMTKDFWFENLSDNDEVDSDVSSPDDDDTPVVVVGVVSEMSPWERGHYIITDESSDHALEQMLSAWQEDRYADEFDEGLMGDIKSEMPEAGEEELQEAYMEAVTEDWNYIQVNYDSLAELMAELKSSDAPQAREIEKMLGSDEFEIEARRRAQVGDVDPSILDMMARTLFVSEWASLMEERGESFSGMELMDVAPDTPPEFEEIAQRLYRDIEQQNNVNLEEFIPPGEDEDFDREDFGYCLAMEALGQGVSWSDDHEDHGLNVPDIGASGEAFMAAEEYVEREHGPAPHEEDVFIEDARGGGYDISAEGKHLGHVVEWDDAVGMVQDWMNENQYWPNVWHINDHGNVSLVEDIHE